MHPSRNDRYNRPHLVAVGSTGGQERHPQLSLNWADRTGRTRTSVRTMSGIPVMFVEGALISRTAKPCREAIDAVLRMRPTRMVVDLGGVREADRTSAELLEAMRRFAHWHGVAISLSAVPGCVNAQLAAVDLKSCFDIHTSSERAVQSALNQPRARRSATPRDQLG